MKSFKTLQKSIKRFHEVAGLAKAPKVSEESIWINVENHKGEYERIQAYKGQSLFAALKYNKVDVGGYCNNYEIWNLREKPIEITAYEPYCKLCSVEIGEEWYKRMPIHIKEQLILEHHNVVPFNPAVKRLSCCITIESWMDEMYVRIPYLLPSDDKALWDETSFEY